MRPLVYSSNILFDFDAIVDIVETGSTLRANGLEVIEKVSDVSTRLIANKVSFKFKKDEIIDLINKLEAVTEEKEC